MKTANSGSVRQTRLKRSYWLANTSVTHLVSNTVSAKLFLASHPLEQKSLNPESLFELLITVDNNHIANLRHVASETCGENMDSFQIHPTKKSDCQLVRLRCVGKATVARVMDAVIAKLDSAEFGRVCRV